MPLFYWKDQKRNKNIIYYLFRDKNCIGRECWSPGETFIPKQVKSAYTVVSKMLSKKDRVQYQCDRLGNCPLSTECPYSKELAKERFEAGWKTFAM